MTWNCIFDNCHCLFTLYLWIWMLCSKLWHGLLDYKLLEGMKLSCASFWLNFVFLSFVHFSRQSWSQCHLSRKGGLVRHSCLPSPHPGATPRYSLSQHSWSCTFTENLGFTALCEPVLPSLLYCRPLGAEFLFLLQCWILVSAPRPGYGRWIKTTWISSETRFFSVYLCAFQICYHRDK